MYKTGPTYKINNDNKKGTLILFIFIIIYFYFFIEIVGDYNKKPHMHRWMTDSACSRVQCLNSLMLHRIR